MRAISSYVAAVLLLMIAIVLVGAFVAIAYRTVQGFSPAKVSLNMPSGEYPMYVNGVYYLNVMPSLPEGSPPISLCGAIIYAYDPSNGGVVSSGQISIGGSIEDVTPGSFSIASTATTISYPPREFILAVTVPKGDTLDAVNIKLCFPNGITSWQELMVPPPNETS